MRVDVSAGRFDLNGVSWGFAFPMPADHWKAEYFANRDLAGAPVVIADEGTGFVDHSWGAGGPTGLPTDHFSARFTRTVTFAASRYRFTLTSDDGGRLWVDDQLVIDGWGDAPLVPHVVEVLLSAGPHTLRYDYFDALSGATARLTWEVRTAAILAAGETLGENQARTSLDGRYTLRYQGDGNLVVTREDTTCAWSSQTNGTSVGVTVMQTNGNFVVYNGDGTPVWNAGTSGHEGAWLEIANDELVVVTPDGARFVIASLLALEPEAASPPATGALAAGLVVASPGSPGDPPAPRAAAVGAASPLLLAVAILCGLAVWRVRHRQDGLLTPCGPQAASRPPQAEWRLRDRRLPATALLLTALLLVPANARAQTTTQVVEYYHTDALGSVRAVTKPVNGQWQVTRHDFMPFGEEVPPQNPQVDKRLFTGKERDAETGLDYFEARYLRAEVGRFTTVDPAMTIEENLADPQRWNRYAYARNNSLKYVDPDGRIVRLGAEELKAVQSLVTEDLRSFIVLNKDGTLDDSALKRVKTDDPAINGLRVLSGSKETYEIAFVTQASFYLDGKLGSAPVSSDQGVLGITLPHAPRLDGSAGPQLWSTTGKNEIYLAKDLPVMEIAPTLRHELLGHALLSALGLNASHVLPNDPRYKYQHVNEVFTRIENGRWR